MTEEMSFQRHIFGTFGGYLVHDMVFFPKLECVLVSCSIVNWLKFELLENTHQSPHV